jgi:tRNA (guanosine-2'-O-)-methyltransferase
VSRDPRLERIGEVLGLRLARVHVALETLHQKHNASAILRTCDALGVQHVHLVTEEEFRPHHGPARGSERWLTLHEHAAADEAIAWLRAHGIALWVADLADDAVAPEAVPLDRPVCLWFGAEHEGVSATARAAADGVVTVPMRGFAQSLNVSVAAALVIRPVAERARELGPDSRLPEAERLALRSEWIAREERLREGIDARDAQRVTAEPE